MTENIIIGAGLTGLSTALHLNKPYIVLEANKQPGGLCGSIQVNEFTFDYSGHFLHLSKDETKIFFKELMGDKLENIKRKAFIYMYNTFVPYPFQANFYALPEKIKNQCLEGFLNRKVTADDKPGQSFYNWSIGTFGSGITKCFMKPYNEKLWTISSKKLTSDWVAPFVPKPSIKDIKDAAAGKNKDFGYNANFFYPQNGGCQAIINAFAAKVKNITYNTSVKKIDYKKRCVYTNSKEVIYYDNLVSTQPLVELLKSIIDLPSEVKEAAKKLKWNSVYCLNVAVKNENLIQNQIINQANWIYYPEKKYNFYRAGFYTNTMPSMAPVGYSSMYVEASRRPEEKINIKTCISDTVKGLIHANVIKDANLELVNCVPIPYAYVIFDKHRQAALDIIQKFLKSQNIFSIGRYGAWEYSFMEKSVLDGKETANLICKK